MENNVTDITLLDEDGKEVEFEVITKLDIQDREYVIVTPKDSKDEEAIILKIDVDDNGDDVLCSVEDDEEFNMVNEAYETLFQEGELDN